MKHTSVRENRSRRLIEDSKWRYKNIYVCVVALCKIRYLKGDVKIIMKVMHRYTRQFRDCVLEPNSDYAPVSGIGKFFDNSLIDIVYCNLSLSINKIEKNYNSFFFAKNGQIHLTKNLALLSIPSGIVDPIKLILYFCFEEFCLELLQKAHHWFVNSILSRWITILLF